MRSAHSLSEPSEQEEEHLSQQPCMQCGPEECLSSCPCKQLSTAKCNARQADQHDADQHQFDVLYD